ncbi:hypothetical protein L1077_19985 [Pseudoalteromonas luteoviolacea]|uniref:hypothetical protein n=1 Tax=Pseudoalteromonas luteoviolacea TaxID=43657 RepID=UPI001F24AB4E|nr:hypothetical protein [Pseudoalteromonas luteoviolacea]MCF6441720.1 hypothetical protein [Pseudoalteromonas luteoviolacea]
MKKYIASLLLLAPLAASASDKDLDVSPQYYNGPITICQYEYSDSYPMSVDVKAKVDIGIQAYMLRYRHRGHIQCQGPIYKNGGIYNLDSQWHTYGTIY